MASSYGREFDQCLLALRQRAPVTVPVTVRTRPRLKYREEEVAGFASPRLSSRGKLLGVSILVDRDLSIFAAIDTLIHEWAHAIDMQDDVDGSLKNPHRASWGVAYARCHRVLYE